MKTNLLEFLQDQYITEAHISLVCQKLIQISFERGDNWYKIKFIHPSRPRKWQVCTLYLDNYYKSEFVYVLSTNEMIIVNSSTYKTALKTVLDNMPNYALYGLTDQINVPIPVYETCEHLSNRFSLSPYFESFDIATKNNKVNFTIKKLDGLGTPKWIDNAILSVDENNVYFKHTSSNKGSINYTNPFRCLYGSYFSLVDVRIPSLKLQVKAMAPNSEEADISTKNVLPMTETAEEALSFIESKSKPVFSDYYS